jgi:hypothetical protein
MGMFESSAEAAAKVRDKILFYGPMGSGKTHTCLTWPNPLLVDVETRGAHFGDRFDFKRAAPPSFEKMLDVFKAIRAGNPDAASDSLILDSYSIIYEKLVVAYTSISDKGNVTTDYASVNRRLAAVREFTMSIDSKNVLLIAHAIEKFARKGNEYTSKGWSYLGDEKFRYALDFIFRVEPTGNDPRTSPPKFHVEKSASQYVKVGDHTTGLDYEKFLGWVRRSPDGSLRRAAAKPAPAQDGAPAADPKAKPEAAAPAQDAGKPPEAAIPPDAAPKPAQRAQNGAQATADGGTGGNGGNPAADERKARPDSAIVDEADLMLIETKSIGAHLSATELGEIVKKATAGRTPLYQRIETVGEARAVIAEVIRIANAAAEVAANGRE